MMITTQPSRDPINQDVVAIRALSSITSQQADIIAQAVRSGKQACTLQTFDDYDGYLSILIELNVNDDEQKFFAITGTAQHLKLFRGCEDDMVAVATFNNAEGLSARLLDLIGQQ